EHSLPHKPSDQNTGLVRAFVDNSNIFIEGKYAIAENECLGPDTLRNARCFSDLYIDYGQLLETILNGRKLGGTPIIVGSCPPPNDALWGQAREQEFTVHVYDRNLTNQEKTVDVAIALAINEAIFTADP
ncbi:12164_t:CDS:1, partial [Racocetra persica]